MTPQYGPPQQPYYPPPPPPRRNPAVIIILAVVILAGFVGCAAVLTAAANPPEKKRALPTSTAAAKPGAAKSAAPAPAKPQPAEEKDSGHTVVYRITGTVGKASVTYAAGKAGDISQDNGAALPWTKTIKVEDGPFLIFHISAQNATGGGKIGCEISFDGKVVATNSSSGAYAVVSCSYSKT